MGVASSRYPIRTKESMIFRFGGIKVEVHTANIRLCRIHLELATELWFVGCANEFLQNNLLVCSFRQAKSKGRPAIMVRHIVPCVTCPVRGSAKLYLVGKDMVS